MQRPKWNSYEEGPRNCKNRTWDMQTRDVENVKTELGTCNEGRRNVETELGTCNEEPRKCKNRTWDMQRGT